MIRLSSKQLKDGMITAQSVFNQQGATFITRGTPLTERYIQRLQKLGVSNLSVTSLSTSAALPPPPDIVDERVREQSVRTIATAFTQLELQDSFDLGTLQNSADALLDSVLAMRSNLVQLSDIRTHDSYTFAHSVNVAILSTMLGSLCRFPREDLKMLTLGGLLHDVGKIDIPHKILNKPGALTDDEFTIMRTHAEKGRQRLAMLPGKGSSLLAAIAGQHHEFLDGRGYPRKLKGEGIHPFARIVAIADVYDALSSKRAYKKSYKPSIVHQIMTKNSTGHFQPDLLNLFFDNVAIFPVGTVLNTSLGYGIVKRVVFGQTQTPIITVFASKGANLLPRPFNVDLAQCPPDTIHHVIDETELINFIRHIGTDPVEFVIEEIEEERKSPDQRIGAAGLLHDSRRIQKEDVSRTRN